MFERKYNIIYNFMIKGNLLYFFFLKLFICLLLLLNQLYRFNVILNLLKTLV